jgi:hypothetical protein
MGMLDLVQNHPFGSYQAGTSGWQVIGQEEPNGASLEALEALVISDHQMAPSLSFQGNNSRSYFEESYLNPC